MLVLKSVSLVQTVSSNSLCVGWKIHAFGSQQSKTCVYPLPSRMVQVRKLASSDRREPLCRGAHKDSRVGLGGNAGTSWVSRKNLDGGWAGLWRAPKEVWEGLRWKVCVGFWSCFWAVSKEVFESRGGFWTRTGSGVMIGGIFWQLRVVGSGIFG